MLNVYFETIDEVTRPILFGLRSGCYSRIKCWFKDDDLRNIARMKDVQPIRYRETDMNLCCYSWDIENVCASLKCDGGLEHLVWRWLHDGMRFVCIDSKEHCKNRIVLFQDARYKTDYPQEFVKVPCFRTLEDLLRYAQEQGVFSFTLTDSQRFKKCNGINPIQGASVYQENKTGYYWYLDMLHKAHYEVFDKTGKKHLGEADLEGNLDTEKADKNKQLEV